MRAARLAVSWVLRGASFLVAPIAVNGCAGDTEEIADPGGGEGGGGSAELPGDSVLGSAPLPGRRAFCDRFAARLSASSDDLCELIGVLQLPNACRAPTQECATDYAEPLAEAEASDRCYSDLDFLPCEGTVDRVEECLDELFGAYSTLSAKLSCSSSEEEITAAVEVLNGVCPDLQESCPALFGDGSSDCCGEFDACGWGDDGECDCPGVEWDALDCAGVVGGECCVEGDPCGWTADGVCDCIGTGVTWDSTDCGT